ncbi:RNA methyltransferase TrmH [Pontibacillus chungwhensis BH030062]|uniref:RNA methyltransferase TrmH n=1 Tax=Pontibacillus chungwhensis BH030062 TaxID=1385513 RepID=A0A0A2UTE4_9BACI|nr:23S rRNA (guanosine(2251)-2'-O)-methyltransferase RlmB [Pontibacillus chungwhensis]KGP89751.1 RNA methyltransferase TrmH [Pontibacillus chungwhensis BH030062]
MKEEWIIGKNAVSEALKSGRSINKVMVSDQLQHKATQTLQKIAKENGVQVQKVPKKKIDQLVDGSHQGVIASVAAYSYSELEDLFDHAHQKGEAPFFLILDEIEDPHNLGSILRTADAAGVHGIIIPKRRSVGLTATVAKTSTGAIEYIPVVRVTNLARTIEDLKKEHVWVVGTDAKGEEDYRQLKGDMPIALVIGSEGKGISRLVKEKCDWSVRLPMVGHVTSLNASVSASLLMYEIHRKRHPLGE